MDNRDAVKNLTEKARQLEGDCSILEDFARRLQRPYQRKLDQDFVSFHRYSHEEERVVECLLDFLAEHPAKQETFVYLYNAALGLWEHAAKGKLKFLDLFEAKILRHRTDNYNLEVVTQPP